MTRKVTPGVPIDQLSATCINQRGSLLHQERAVMNFYLSVIPLTIPLLPCSITTGWVVVVIADRHLQCPKENKQKNNNFSEALATRSSSGHVVSPERNQ